MLSGGGVGGGPGGWCEGLGGRRRGRRQGGWGSFLSGWDIKGKNIWLLKHELDEEAIPTPSLPVLLHGGYVLKLYFPW